MTRFEVRIAGLVRLATGVVFLAEGYGKVTSDFVRGGFARSASEMAGQAWPFWGHPRIAARHRDPSRTVLCARFVLGPLGDRRPPKLGFACSCCFSLPLPPPTRLEPRCHARVSPPA